MTGYTAIDCFGSTTPHMMSAGPKMSSTPEHLTTTSCCSPNQGQMKTMTLTITPSFTRVFLVFTMLMLYMWVQECWITILGGLTSCGFDGIRNWRRAIQWDSRLIIWINYLSPLWRMKTLSGLWIQLTSCEAATSFPDLPKGGDIQMVLVCPSALEIAMIGNFTM